MAVGSVLVGLTILALIIVFVVVVVWGWFQSRSIGEKEIVDGLTPTPGLMLTLCDNGRCKEGLECDPYSGFCKAPLGGACNFASDCIAPAFCSGVCVIGANGGLNQFCPCSAGLSCVKNPLGAWTCKGAGGASCKKGEDCASGSCVSGLCRIGQPFGTMCTTDSQCGEGAHCVGLFDPSIKEKYCQPGLYSGTLGAVCGIEKGLAPCEPGFTCGPNNTCAQPTVGLIEPCSSVNICPGGQECRVSTGALCKSTDCNGVCRPPFPSPNLFSQVCAGGMTKIDTECFNGQQLGCELDSMCGSGLRCGGSTTLVKYGFQNFKMMGAKSINIRPVAVSTLGDIAVKKMSHFAITDHIVALASNIGNGGCGTGGNTGIYKIIGSPEAKKWVHSGNGTFTMNGRTITVVDSYYDFLLVSETDGSQTYSTLYKGFEITGVLTPAILGTLPWPGILYYGTKPIEAMFVARNLSNGLMITGSDGNAYVAPITGQDQYGPFVLIPNVRGPIRPYNINSAPLYPPSGGYAWISTVDGLIHLSTNPESVFPISPVTGITYDVIDFDLRFPGYGIALVKAFQGSTFIGYQIVVSDNQNLITALPYQVGPCSRVVMDTYSFYVSSPASCSRT